MSPCIKEELEKRGWVVKAGKPVVEESLHRDTVSTLLKEAAEKAGQKKCPVFLETYVVSKMEGRALNILS
jgi:hypothetical protein